MSEQVIINYLKNHYYILISDLRAEHIVGMLNLLLYWKRDVYLEISGRNTITGFPDTITISTKELFTVGNQENYGNRFELN